jgi:hypothetical protein
MTMVTLHPGQSRVFREIFLERSSRFFVVCCSRGWGKSFKAAVAALTAVHELMHLPDWVPNKVVYIIAPTHDQVTDIYFPIVAYELGGEYVALKHSRDLGRFWFPGNVELRMLSYEAVERIRGKGAYFVVWDEVSSCRKGMAPREAWEGVVQPAIITRWSPSRAKQFGAPSPGRALFISTPKGFNYFYDLYHNHERDVQWRSHHFDYTTSPFLDREDIERLRANLDPVEFASEYLASFKESGNNVFYMFDRKTNVVQDLPSFEEGETVYLNIDFNVGIQATSAMALRGSKIHVLREFRGHPDTESLAIMLKETFKGHELVAFPDPTGRSRKTSAAVGRTDFTILQSNGIKTLARSSSPSIVDSVAAVNGKLMNANGVASLLVSPECPGVIRSLERTKWVDGRPETATIDKSEGVEHFSDGLRYGIEYMFPIRSGQKRSARGFNF